MVLPLIGALAGAGGSIASALIGADAQSENNATNWLINLYNNRQRNKERAEARQYADELRGEQKLGATDALGNRTYFKEGEGWISELSPEQQELYDYFFSQELPERQAQFQRGAQRSRAEDDVANNLLEQFQRIALESPREIEAMLYQNATHGINEATRDTVETAMRQGLRMGNNNLGELLGKVGSASMDQRAQARTQSKLQAKDYADTANSRKQSGLAQLYQMFAGQSDQQLGASYDPSGIPEGARSLMNVFSNQAQQGNSQGLAAAQMRGGSLDYVEPDFGAANAAGAIGNSLAGLGDRVGSYNERNEMNDLLKMYIQSGGQFNLAGGGILDSLSDRLAYGNQRSVF